ncbi:uncharacterized protein M6B38_303875 [Iris pallida]|uniref:DUF1664 domain-containing protein n=1 Tax=Iris pallida TaxID=29817 RepID=A0AAX6HN17_IRIPA|nr:uncharacterized protein M6B38_303875 [Iris pallida]
MALQTGVASSKVLILIGAGLTGSIVLRNGRLSDILSELQELLKGANEVEISSKHYDTSALAAQIRHLAQEVRDLTLSRPVTIFNGESSSSGNITSYIVPAAAVGAMGYCYMWWKGWSFSDVMFVTKRNMANAVATVSKQLDQVSAALTATKRHLTQRLENLDGKLDEQKEISKLIMGEVNEVRCDLSQIGFDIESIQNMVSGLEGRLGLLENKQDMGNAGIYYLCQVAGGFKDGINGKIFQEAAAKLQSSHPSLAIAEDNSLKGLRYLADSIKSIEPEQLKTGTTGQKDLQEKPVTRTHPKTTTIHRSSGISVRKAGFAL